MSKTIFISYSTKDTEMVRKIKKDIEQDGHRIWIYPVAIDPGLDIVKSEKDGIENCDFVIIMLSATSVKSTAVTKEIALAKDVERRTGKKKLLYVRIDSKIPLRNKDAIQISDLSNEFVYAIELHRLLRKITDHKNYTIVQTVRRYLSEPGWFKVKLQLAGNLRFVKEVDYHLHPELAAADDTDDHSDDSRRHFSIEFYTDYPEIVYAVVRLSDGSTEEIKHFVRLHE